MRLEDNGSSHHEPTWLEVTASIGASVCFITVVAIFIRKLFNRISGFCKEFLKDKNDEKKPPKVDYNNDYVQLRLRAEPGFGRLKPSNRSYSLPTISLYDFPEFPSSVESKAIQPQRSNSTSEYSTESVRSYGDSLDSISEDNLYVSEYVQPHPSPRISRTSMDSFMPELYTRRRTQGRTSLGKVKLSLEYEDNKKHKLIMHLIEVTNLLLLPDSEPSCFYLSAVLLPDREYVLESKKIQSTNGLKFDDLLTFFSRSEDSEFQSRTIHLTIMSVAQSGKEVIYGELHIPLLAYEIFCQIPTELSIGIKSYSSQAAIGDAQVVLSYFSGQKKLNVLVKTLKFINPVLEHMRGIQVKVQLASLQGDRLSKKKSISKSLSALRTTNVIRFGDHMSFNIDSENFMLCILKIHIQGRHKLIRKPTNIGKVRIGDSIRDETGKIHWRTVANSEETSWTIWHNIYTS